MPSLCMAEIPNTSEIKITKNLDGNKKLKDFCIKRGIDMNENYWKESALIWASYGCVTDIIQLLLEQEGIDINAQDCDGYTALILASWNGYTEIVKLLLEQKDIL